MMYLIKYGVRDKMLDVIKSMYVSVRSRIIYQHILSDEICVNACVMCQTRKIFVFVFPVLGVL